MKITQPVNICKTGQCTKRLLPLSFKLSPLSLQLSAFCLSFLLFGPAQTFAAEFDGTLKEIKITDSAGANQPPTAVINYTQDGATFAFDATESSDQDGNIVEYKWDFGDGSTATGITASHNFNTGTNPVTLTTKDNEGAVALSQINIVYIANIAVNFQPEKTDIPESYLADYGLIFDQTKGYGWIVNSLKDKIDRNSSISPDQAYDTLINVYPDAIWEITIPNGTYKVKVVAGDPSYPWGTQNVQAEGVPIIQNVIISSSLPWVEGNAIIEVEDRALTLTFAKSNPMTKICFIKIESI